MSRIIYLKNFTAKAVFKYLLLLTLMAVVIYLFRGSIEKYQLFRPVFYTYFAVVFGGILWIVIKKPICTYCGNKTSYMGGGKKGHYYRYQCIVCDVIYTDSISLKDKADPE